MLDLNETTFTETVNSSEPVLVDFFATWCQPCNMLSRHLLPKVEKDIKIAKVNTEEQTALAHRYDISALPTLIFFKNGLEVKRLVGLQSEASLRAAIAEVKA